MYLDFKLRDFLKSLKGLGEPSLTGLVFDALLIGSMYVVYAAVGGRLFWMLLAVAVVVFFVLNCFFHWTVPRRLHHPPAIVVCFLGAFTFGLTLRRFLGDDDLWQLVFAAAAGAFLFLYIAVKIGSPQSVVIRVRHDADDCVVVSPEHFLIGGEGSVTWFFESTHPEAAKGRVEFQRYKPFEEDVFDAELNDRSPRRGYAMAGPAVNPGDGDYWVRLLRNDDSEICSKKIGGCCCPTKHA